MQQKGQDALLEKLPKSLGTAVGLELRDNTHGLTASNDKLVQAGMTFKVSIGKFAWTYGLFGQEVCTTNARPLTGVVLGAAGLTDLVLADAGDDEAKKKYAILLADTIATKPGGAAPEIATAAAPKAWKDVAYYLKVSEGSQPAGRDRHCTPHIHDPIAHY